MGLSAARNYAKGESLVVYMGEDIGPADEPPTVNTLKGQSQHTLQIEKKIYRKPPGRWPARSQLRPVHKLGVSSEQREQCKLQRYGKHCSA